MFAKETFRNIPGAFTGGIPWKFSSFTLSWTFFADDLAIYSTSRFCLQQALHSLDAYVRQAGLQINRKKTEAMEFRRGGRLTHNDVLRTAGQELDFVSRFFYLEVTLRQNGRYVSAHVLDRFKKALVATLSTSEPSKPSIETALVLFRITNIPPPEPCGLQLIWERTPPSDLALLDRTKPTFLKTVLSLHGSVLNRIVYILVRAPLYVEDLIRKFALRETDAYREFRRNYETKLASVDHGLFYTIDMSSTEWRGPNQGNRNLVARLATHGFHFRLCKKERCRKPGETCVSRRCGLACPRYLSVHQSNPSQAWLIVSPASTRSSIVYNLRMPKSIREA